MIRTIFSRVIIVLFFCSGAKSFAEYNIEKNWKEIEKDVCEVIDDTARTSAWKLPDYKEFKRSDYLMTDVVVSIYTYNCELTDYSDTSFGIEFKYDQESFNAIIYSQDGNMNEFQLHKKFYDYGKIKCLFTSNYEWECLYEASSFLFRTKERLRINEGNAAWTAWTEKQTQSNEYYKRYLDRLMSKLKDEI